MRTPDLLAPDADPGFMRAEPHGAFEQRDRLLDRPGEELALADKAECARRVAIGREHRLVFGYGLRKSALCAQHLVPGPTHVRVARCRGAGLSDQGFCALDIGSGRVAQIIGYPT